MFETMFVVVMGLIVAIGIGAEIVYNIPDKRKGMLLAILAGIVIGVLCRGIIEAGEMETGSVNKGNQTYGEGEGDVQRGDY